MKKYIFAVLCVLLFNFLLTVGIVWGFGGKMDLADIFSGSMLIAYLVGVVGLSGVVCSLIRLIYGDRD